MDKISAWCKMITLISILSSVLMLVLPEGKSKKAFKMLFSFIIIYSFVSTLSEIRTDFSHISKYFDDWENSAVSEDFNDYENYPIISAAESETEKYFNDLLSNIGMEGYCEAVCDTEAGRIILLEIYINAKADESQKKTIAEEVVKIYGEETTIIFSGEQ